MNTTLLTSAIGMVLMGSQVANAALVTGVLGNGTWSTNHANFTMLSPTGATIGGTNNVNFFWDGNAYNSSTDYTGPGGASNVTASSTSTFYSRPWAAHDIQMFLPGTYSFDTSLMGGQPESGMLNVTVPEGSLGMHMLFDWYITSNPNIDMFVVFELNSLFGSGIVRNSANASDCDSGIIQNCLWNVGTVTGHNPTANQVWMLASADGNGDGIMGIPMAPNGPFAGFNANFNANLDFTPTVPVPAATWLFGSGLAGLLAVARRRNSARV